MEKARRIIRDRVYSSPSWMETLYLALTIYIVVDAVILAWFFAAPLFVTSASPIPFGIAMSAYNWGYLLSNCHQMPQRTAYIFGQPFPFCARDMGIYIGCLIGALAAFRRERLPQALRSPIAFVALCAPLAIDGVTQTILALRESSNGIRMATGLAFGFGMVYFFAEKIVGNSQKIGRSRQWRKASVLAAALIISLLALSHSLSGSYVTADEAVKRSGIDPSMVVYIPARPFSTIRADPYLRSYDDAVLSAMAAHGRGKGAWLIVEGDVEREGRYVFFSRGKFRLIPDQ